MPLAFLASWIEQLDQQRDLEIANATAHREQADQADRRIQLLTQAQDALTPLLDTPAAPVRPRAPEREQPSPPGREKPGQPEKDTPAPADPPAKPAATPARANDRTDITPSTVLALISEHADEDGWVQIGALTRDLKVNRKVVLRRLKILISEGLVHQEGNRGSTRYRAINREPTKQTTAAAPRPPRATVPKLNPGVKPASVAPAERVAPAPRPENTSGQRPAGEQLRDKIEIILRRGDPRSAGALARDLVIPVSEVQEQLDSLKRRGTDGEGPIILKADGCYHITATEAARWGSPAR